jgi:hypothetical protein
MNLNIIGPDGGADARARGAGNPPSASRRFSATY